MLKPVDARPKNWLVPIILVVLREDNSHGYELMERLEGFGFVAMNPGTLYKTLRRMENEGLCESEWETSESGPSRRMYSATDAGEECSVTWAEGCEKYQRVLGAFSRAYARRG